MPIITGNTHTDQRGAIRFVNDFHFEGVKRFYSITHPDVNVIRAWQGHKLETKYFYVSKGSFCVNWIGIDDWENPSQDLTIHTHLLSDQQSEILIIPPGHVNGFKALEPDSILMVFSDMSLEDSKNDDFRFPVTYWKIKDKS